MYARYLKRPLDFFCALAAIICLSPVLVVLTVLGAIKMKGNPFFMQPRPGLNEKIFKLIKFRTMTNEKDAQGHLLPDDKRLNAYGKFLRSTSLDFFLLGGSALPHRHALFCGASLRLAARAPLTKPSLAPLAVIPAQAGISLLVPRVSALACHDRCRETLVEAT